MTTTNALVAIHSADLAAVTGGGWKEVGNGVLNLGSYLLTGEHASDDYMKGQRHNSQVNSAIVRPGTGTPTGTGTFGPPLKAPSIGGGGGGGKIGGTGTLPGPGVHK
jgi:hypothetical protein